EVTLLRWYYGCAVIKLKEVVSLNIQAMHLIGPRESD
ncbi:MAG: hypothetical protein ACI9J2_002112, partial [Saprospiraceae bacterium]